MDCLIEAGSGQRTHEKIKAAWEDGGTQQPSERFSGGESRRGGNTGPKGGGGE